MNFYDKNKKNLHTKKKFKFLKEKDDFYIRIFTIQ